MIVVALLTVHRAELARFRAYETVAIARARAHGGALERVIELTDHRKAAEVIISTIEVTEGRDAADVVSSWSGDTSLVVRDAVKGLTKGTGASAGPVAL